MRQWRFREPMGHRWLDRTFRVSLVLKCLDGIVETIGGVLLLVVSGAAIHRLAVRATWSELSQDPNDWIARHVLRVTAGLHGTQTFGGIYLVSHGVVKVVLVVALLRDRLWAYPWMLAFLGLFIAYQGYRMVDDASAGLVLLTIFDVLILGLTWREYALRRPAAHRPSR